VQTAVCWFCAGCWLARSRLNRADDGRAWPAECGQRLRSKRLANVFQMNDRIGATLAVKRRAARTLETHFFVKAQCLSILLVNIGRHLGMEGKAVTNECGTNARATASGVNKQGLHMPVVDEHKCQRVIIGIRSEPEWNCWQQVANHLIDGLAVLLGQKMMCRINRAAPDFHGTLALTGTGISNADHLLIMSAIVQICACNQRSHLGAAFLLAARLDSPMSAQNRLPPTGDGLLMAMSGSSPLTHNRS